MNVNGVDTNINANAPIANSSYQERSVIELVAPLRVGDDKPREYFFNFQDGQLAGESQHPIERRTPIHNPLGSNIETYPVS